MKPSNREPLADLLERWGACNEALEWAGSYGKEYERAWLECERGDWMVWWLRHLDVSDSLLRLIACDIARTVLHLVPKGEERPRKAIEVAERYAVGETSRDELVAARSAAAASAAAGAAAASAAAYDAAAASAYDAAAYAAYDASAYAYDAASASAARAEHAEIVRRRCSGMTFGKREDLR